MSISGVINSNRSRDEHQPVTNRDRQEVFHFVTLLSRTRFFCLQNSPVHHPLILVKTPETALEYFTVKYLLHGTRQRTGLRSLFYSVTDARGLARRISVAELPGNRYASQWGRYDRRLCVLEYCDSSARNVQSASTVLGSVSRKVIGTLAEIPDGHWRHLSRQKAILKQGIFCINAMNSL
ncbi:hypothetical protein B9Z19DRAFT_130844 [Tuber borchii]|uniref:Uncharacterized protein n=1 Tax=Tuber borchii TaxID=42251 RepID=A0A2T6ZQX3_TUBBO|nr:hypothetical protein B9Z19DRAFT_130844 [Tuber borchii]